MGASGAANVPKTANSSTSDDERTVIPTGRRGRVLAGKDKGCFVCVQDDRARTGGYLVLTAADKDFTLDAGDYWVPEDDLTKFFQESGWLLEWEGDAAEGTDSPRQHCM
jgi:hypothetical protein